MRFKEGLIIGVSVVLLTGGVSYASEAPLTGFSVGAFAGYTWSDLDYSEYYGEGWSPGNVSNIDGGVLGIVAGYNYQINKYVLGLEGDVGISDQETLADNGYANLDFSWTAHIRAKAGMVFHNNTSVYVAAGLALASIEIDDIDPYYGKDDNLHVGWTVGCGIDYKATENIVLRLEYLYDNFGSEDYYISYASDYYDGDYSINIDDLEMHTVRLGVSYQF